ncbi:MAG: nucleotidyltransferase family protein [Caulobacter sp.]|nr:nucleotidyltransferase family protein [Caulobacter sp.]
MTREDVLQVLRDHEAELREQGVIHAALFGSLARGEAGPKSDIDVAIRFDPDAPITLWGYAGLKRRVSGMLRGFKRKVDVIDLDGMSPYVRPSVERDAIYAF